MTGQENIGLIETQRLIRKNFSKERIQEWMKPSETKVFADLFLDWLLIAAAFAFFVFFQTWWSAVIAFFVIGLCQYRLFILGHDGLHGNLSKNRARNDFIARWLIYAPMFMGFNDAKRNHLSHHQLLGTPEDPDRYIHLLDNKNSRFKFLLFCSGLATFGKTVLKVTPFGKMFFSTEKPSENMVEAKPAAVLKDYIIERIPVLIWQIVIFAAFIFFGVWWLYPILWVAPIYFLVFLPDEIRAFCDHGVLRLSNKETDADRLITFTSNPVERVFFSPHNMNYHAEHHLWVGVPYYNLPKVHREVKEIPEITVRGSYLVFLFQVIKNLPLKISKNA